MKIAIVALYEAFPPVSGAATVTYSIAKYLSDEKYLIQMSERGNRNIIDKNINLINIGNTSNNRMIKAVNLAKQIPHITKVIKHLTPEIIILEGASWVFYLLMLYYLIRLSGLNQIIIYHAHNVEYLLRRQKNGRLIASITKWAEGEILKKCDLSFAVSKVDALQFEEIYGVKPLILANGVDFQRFERINDDDITKIKKQYNLDMRTVLFMGMPAYKPNQEAIDFLIKEVFPLVVEKRNDIKLVVIGGQLKYKIDWLINPGTIPFHEIPIFIKACDICVAPIFSGSGTRLKILEYMAAGKPVISTAKGAEGIKVTDGLNIVIANKANQFIEEILFLFKHPEVGQEIGRGGEILVRANYCWQTIMEKFSRAIRSYIAEIAK